MSNTKSKAVFAMGCFWGVEAFFKKIPGVLSTTVGYTGGHVPDPTYEKVCTGTTGHAEAILIEFDPEVVSYGSLVEMFFEHHDPTTLNRQGPDVGEQYRSAIFYQDESQKQTAEEVRDRLERNKRFARPIVTEIAAAAPFYAAEEYHQDYVDKNPSYVCHI